LARMLLRRMGAGRSGARGGDGVLSFWRRRRSISMSPFLFLPVGCLLGLVSSGRLTPWPTWTGTSCWASGWAWGGGAAAAPSGTGLVWLACSCAVGGGAGVGEAGRRRLMCMTASGVRSLVGWCCCCCCCCAGGVPGAVGDVVCVSCALGLVCGESMCGGAHSQSWGAAMVEGGAVQLMSYIQAGAVLGGACVAPRTGEVRYPGGHSPG
jgi:hypothetical protein